MNKEATPPPRIKVPISKPLITGANGQLGLALQQKYPDGVFTDVKELDITNYTEIDKFDFEDVDAIINAAGYTNVDGAELPENADILEAVNVNGPAGLATKAAELDIPFVHLSTDYVFDGQHGGAHKEKDKPHPVSAYGKSKLASEVASQNSDRLYIVRTSWVIGEGNNFVRTMLELGKAGVNPTVVSDQIGRPTFATTLAEAIVFLLSKPAKYGTYNVTNGGGPVSWANFAREIFEITGYDITVTDSTTKDYLASKPDSAPRPLNSVLDLGKIGHSGFSPPDWRDALKKYVKSEKGAK